MLDAARSAMDNDKPKQIYADMGRMARESRHTQN
jgi:hypothetical protein